jgi:hypothetical protein
MIRYALACDKAHEFESWFPSSAAYDAQKGRGLVSCPVCGSQAVEKQIMAPALTRRDKPAAPPSESPSAIAEVPGAPPAPQPVAMFSERERELRAMFKAFREHVEKNTEHVGERFPNEARKMHYGEIEHRSIYGQASPAEARELIEEGIEIHPFPVIPDERN